MATVSFAKAFQRHVAAPAATVPGRTAAEVLTAYFQAHPAVRHYVIDDQGAVRRHVAVFVDGIQLADRVGQSDMVGPDGDVHVFQALSGG